MKGSQASGSGGKAKGKAKATRKVSDVDEDEDEDNEAPAKKKAKRDPVSRYSVGADNAGYFVVPMMRKAQDPLRRPGPVARPCARL
jgi:hypothetical protein